MEMVRVELEGGSEKVVRIGSVRFPLAPFLEAVLYILRYGTLAENDPRRVFVERVQRVAEINGPEPDSRRLAEMIKMVQDSDATKSADPS